MKDDHVGLEPSMVLLYRFDCNSQRVCNGYTKECLRKCRADASEAIWIKTEHLAHQEVKYSKNQDKKGG